MADNSCVLSVVEADLKVRLYVRPGRSIQRNPCELFEMLAPRAVGGNEPLDALAREDLTSVDVPPRIGRDHMQAEELSAVLAHAAKLTDHLARFTLEEPHVVVRKVGDVEVLLRLVGRERDTARRSAHARVLRQLELLLEVPLLV